MIDFSMFIMYLTVSLLDLYRQTYLARFFLCVSLSHYALRISLSASLHLPFSLLACVLFSLFSALFLHSLPRRLSRCLVSLFPPSPSVSVWYAVSQSISLLLIIVILTQVVCCRDLQGVRAGTGMFVHMSLVDEELEDAAHHTSESHDEQEVR